MRKFTIMDDADDPIAQTRGGRCLVLGFNFGGGASNTNTNTNSNSVFNTNSNSNYNTQDNSQQKGVNTVQAPDWWTKGLGRSADDWAAFQGQYIDPTTGGLTAGQQGGANALYALNGPGSTGYGYTTPGSDAGTGVGATGTGAAQTGQDFLHYISTNLLDPFVHGDATTAGQVGSVADVTAKNGADFMGQYTNPWENDVVNTSLADYDTGVNRAANSYRAGAIGNGGQAGGATPVASGVLAADAARGRGTLAAGIRSQGFQFGATQGQSDAQRALAAAQGNQGAALQRNIAQAGLDQSTSQFNANTKLSAIDSVTKNALQSVQYGIDANDTAARNAINAMVAGGMGLDQAIKAYQAGLAPYQIAPSGFGNTTDQTGSSSGSGTQTGNEGGTASTSGNTSSTNTNAKFGFSI